MSGKMQRYMKREGLGQGKVEVVQQCPDTNFTRKTQHKMDFKAALTHSMTQPVDIG